MTAPTTTVTRTIHLVGDSTAGPKSSAAAPETGWGMALPYYLTDDVALVNHARNGRSTKSFADQGRLRTALDAVRPGDVLLIQFGHNDAKESDPERYTEPWTSYSQNLRDYVAGARAAGAQPVLATPVERRRFDDSGDAVPSHGDYPDAMRAVAEDEGVPVVDTQRASLAQWQELGPEQSIACFLRADDGRQDDTHFSPQGASVVARMVAAGLVEAGVLSEDQVRRLDEPVPTPWYRWLPGDPE